jgi:hypothetical protein
MIFGKFTCLNTLYASYQSLFRYSWQRYSLIPLLEFYLETISFVVLKLFNFM